MAKQAKRLGRGLSSLVSDLREPPRGLAPAEPPAGEVVPERTARLTAEMADVSALHPNPFQPRETINDVGLISLAESLRNSGMIQPISARQSEGRLEIIAGERRWRAARLAGMTSVPVVVRSASDREMLEMALVENIHREDLNAIDRAKAYQQYCERFGLSAEAVAQRVGEDRTTVTNYLRLLELEQEIKVLVAEGKLSMGHARCIVGLPEETERLRLAKAVVAHGLSVRALEGIARRERGGRERSGGGKGAEAEKTPHLRDLEERFAVATGTKVTIQEGRRKGSGKVIVEYYSLDDFDRIASMLGVSKGE